MPQVVVGVGVGIVVNPLFVAREESLGGKESAFQRKTILKDLSMGFIIREILWSAESGLPN